MPKRTKSYDSWLLKELTDPIVAANYINAASEDSDEMLLVAMRNVAEAHKMARVAREANVSRESLYRTLSDEGNPRLQNFRTILGTFGLKIKVTPKDIPAVVEVSNISQQAATSGSITSGSITSGGKIDTTFSIGSVGTIINCTTEPNQNIYQNISETVTESLMTSPKIPAALLIQAAKSDEITVGS